MSQEQLETAARAVSRVAFSDDDITGWTFDDGEASIEGDADWTGWRITDGGDRLALVWGCLDFATDVSNCGGIEGAAKALLRAAKAWETP